MSSNCTLNHDMEDHFTFESKYIGSRMKMFRIRTSDQTEWTVFDDWRTAQKSKDIVQKLSFQKENFYDKCYRINLEVRSACENVDGAIKVSKTAEPILTKFIIPRSLFKKIKVKNDIECPCNKCDCNRQFLYSKEVSDIFRYDITITRLQELPNDSLKIPEREELLKFSDQISCILENEQFSDFIIYCGNFPINVHKNILYARAPYFQSMLTSRMKEARSNRLDFTDISITAFREVLHYIYSGVLRPVTLAMVYDIFVLSDRFQINDLKALCSQILQNHISCHNAASFLDLADQHHAESLKSSCVEFIALNIHVVKKFDRGFEKLNSYLTNLIESIKRFPNSK